ncbi:MAG: AmmeMemoRadiSam system protein B [Euryarchaeota archaeon]|nr:AmmeMemoRadiSam system protein B [Euryarchaeota archaeon]
MLVKIRRPAVSGQFYWSDPKDLLEQISDCYKHILGPRNLPETKAGPRKIVGAVAPHAGYMYSGPVAAHTYNELAADGIPDTVVIIGPNHTGVGSGVAIMVEGAWQTPLGTVEIDSDLAKQIIKKSETIDSDETAHYSEHSIEVQLPFLQHIYNEKFKFIPICMMMQDLDTAREVGKAIAVAAKDKNVVILASTDFTHYESQKIALDKDLKAIDAIINLNETKLVERVIGLNISMCGYGPVAAMIVAAKNLQAKEGKLLKYATSGDITNDYSHVVGYGSIAIRK